MDEARGFTDVCFRSYARISVVAATSISAVSHAAEFELVVGEHELAALGVDSTGSPNLTVFDQSGNRLTNIGEANSSEGLYTYDGNTLVAGTGALRGLWGSASGSVGDQQYDAESHLRVYKSITSDAAAGLFINDEYATKRIGVFMDPSNSVDGMALYDVSGVIRLGLDAAMNQPSHVGTGFVIDNGLNLTSITFDFVNDTNDTDIAALVLATAPNTSAIGLSVSSGPTGISTAGISQARLSGGSLLFPDQLSFQVRPSSDSTLNATTLQVGDWSSNEEEGEH